jgi:3-oxoacyl-[acyl-carrier protein] reductase
MKVALVTGGARGIGRRIALGLAERGYAVAIAYRTSDADAKSAVRDLESTGAPALAACADVSDPAACQKLVDDVTAWRGPIATFVHCAGPYHRKDILAETPEGWRAMFANNLDSLFYLSRLIAPQMIQAGWGRIVAFSMANAEKLSAQPGVTAHYLAKVGVLGLVRTLAKSLASHKITVNAVSPGFVDSGSADADDLKAALKNIPAGAIGTVDDAAAAALWFVSEESSYTTGSNLIVSGGWGL